MNGRIPVEGLKWNDLRAMMEEMRRGDIQWRRGRHAAYVWYANEEVEKVAKEAYGMFLSENGLAPHAFPSLRRMEEEVIGMTAKLLHGAEAAGSITSGGTESIFLAAKAARDWGRKQKPGIGPFEIVAPFSAHPAINKAAHYLGMKVIRVPTGEDFRADPEQMAAAITSNTIMLYASAPAYSLGVIDPIEELAKLAAGKGLWLHVDACVGGILAPFVEKLGYPVPRFDIGLEGVTSLSADLHKSGYTAKGASALLFRTQELHEYSRFSFEEWPSGLYSSPTFTGTRPGGAIASAWAVMNFLGEKGYLKIAKQVMEARQRFVGGLRHIPGIHIWGNPDLWAIAFGSKVYNIREVAKSMHSLGWAVATVRQPAGIHLMITPIHEPIIEEYLTDLRRSIERHQRGELSHGGLDDRY